MIRPRKADIALIQRLHEAGYTTPQIALQAKVSERTVDRHLRILRGGAPKPIFNEVTPDREARILRLAREGLPDGWIAEDVGVSQQTVSNYRKSADIPVSAGWKLARLEIQHNPILFELHHAFAPVALRRS